MLLNKIISYKVGASVVIKSKFLRIIRKLHEMGEIYPHVTNRKSLPKVGDATTHLQLKLCRTLWDFN